MPEVYTCKCGFQHWVIAPGEIICVQCHTRYTIDPLMHPGEFNECRSDYEREET